MLSHSIVAVGRVGLLTIIVLLLVVVIVFFVVPLLGRIIIVIKVSILVPVVEISLVSGIVLGTVPLF